ncbi:hypothetical protein D915_005990 [Fasciola hepatica]|uniref:Uncharacterized protein n=1 Tax=Fasciola hepatica TaxID=6192 RepID=A0A4E0R425_FASHE|nr:hypothetical protein D915_005990 [Fasciola hepatica]
MSANGKQRRPLLWTCLLFTTFGLLCSVVAFVLPYWYARYPQSKSRFLRLGLWEICFEDFMPADLGNLMYTGCFYLYDRKIRALWSLIFRTWFVVCQVFHTFSFVAYVMVEVVLITQVCNLVSSRGPRAVLFSIIASGATLLFVLISSVTMGTGVDAESKRKPSAEQDWLISLDQCSLSWAYGISLLSLLGCLVPFVILCWCVYPKRSPSGLLSVSAWDWPNRGDLICQYHLNDLRALSSQAQSLRSRSVTTSGDVGSVHPFSHSSLCNQTPLGTASAATRDMLISAKPVTTSAVVNAVPLTSARQRSRHSRSRSGCDRRTTHRIPESVSQTSWETNGKLSSYDPRSPDSISLLSYEHHAAPPPMKSPRNTASEQSSIVTQESSTKTNPLNSRSTSGGIPAQEDRRNVYEFESPAMLSAATLTLEGAAGSMQLSTGWPSRLRSTTSGVDTSVWTADSSVQAARPMGRSHSKSNLKQTSGRSASPTSSEQPTPEELTPRPVVQAAKPMRRKHQ